MKSLNKTYIDILGDAYKRYQTETMFNSDNKWLNELDGVNLGTGEKGKVYRQFTPEEFINKIKTDDEFAKEWGAVIETKDLAVKDRLDWTKCNHPNIVSQEGWVDLYENLEDAVVWFNSFDIGKIAPTKIITITYKNETAVSYE